MAFAMTIIHSLVDRYPSLSQAMRSLDEKPELNCFRKTYDGTSIEQVATAGLAIHAKAMEVFAQFLKETDQLATSVDLALRATRETGQFEEKEKLLDQFQIASSRLREMRGVKYDLYQRTNYALTCPFDDDKINQSNRLIPSNGDDLRAAQEGAAQHFEQLLAGADAVKDQRYDLMKLKLGAIAPNIVRLHNEVELKRDVSNRRNVVESKGSFWSPSITDVPQPEKATLFEKTTFVEEADDTSPVRMSMAPSELMQFIKSIAPQIKLYQRACGFLFLKGEKLDSDKLLSAMRYFSSEGKDHPKAEENIYKLRILVFEAKPEKLTDIDLSALLETDDLTNEQRATAVILLIERENFLAAKPHLEKARAVVEAREVEADSFAALKRRHQAELLDYCIGQYK